MGAEVQPSRSNRETTVFLLTVYLGLVAIHWIISRSLLGSLAISPFWLLIIALCIRGVETNKKTHAQIKSLIAILADNDQPSEEYQHAIEELVKYRRPALKPLIRLFTSTDDLIKRVRIGDALRQIGKPAVGPLIKLLSSKKGTISTEAQTTLIRIGRPAVNPLIRKIKDKKVWVGVRSALIAIGEPAIEPLIKKLDDKKYAEAATETLFAIGKPAIVQLTAATKSKNKKIAKQAKNTLSKIQELKT